MVIAVLPVWVLSVSVRSFWLVLELDRPFKGLL
jgi:hypothetical protein